MKKVKNYFPHDFNARNDKKLEKVRYKVGLEGVGLYWCIIEFLYENDGYLSLSEDVELLSYQLRVDKDLINDLIENYDLFKKNKNKFYSEGVLKRLEEISNRANQNRMNVLKRWGKQRENLINKNDTNVLPKEYESNTNVLQSLYYKKENKKKENKIKKNKINILNTTTTTTNNIFSFIESNFCRTLSPIEYEKIELWLSECDEDVLKEAIKISVLNQKATFQYVDGILKNWKALGIKRVEDIPKSNINKQLNDKDINILKETMEYDWLERGNDELV